MTIDELRKGNRLATAAVLLTALTIALTILVKSIIEISGTTQRLVALEKIVETQRQEIAVIHEDVKELLKKR